MSGCYGRHEWLLRTTCEPIVVHAAHSERAARDRDKATGPGSQAKKYVNIAGGRAKGGEVAEAFETTNAFLHHLLPVKEGWPHTHPSVSVVPGPLLRTTSGGYNTSGASSI